MAVPCSATATNSCQTPACDSSSPMASPSNRLWVERATTVRKERREDWREAGGRAGGEERARMSLVVWEAG